MSRKNITREVKVWDPLVRIFHWSLVCSFAVAWLSADEFETVHVWMGYTVAALVSFRVVWGVIGTRHARFSDFIYRLSTVKSYLRTLLSGSPKHYVGHNPAGGLMVVALLAGLGFLTFTGMLTIAADGEGPLANTPLAGLSGNWTEEIHELFANFILLLVLLHIGGVVVSSLLHRENLVRAMVTGRKTIQTETSDEPKAL